MRRAVAVLLHVPGLRILFGFRPPRRLVRVNVLAVVITLAAMAIAGSLAPVERRWLWVAITWAVGHMAWGGYLSTQIDPKEARLESRR
jgi:hypothetical protein